MVRRERLRDAGFDDVILSGTAGDPALRGAVEAPLGRRGGGLTIFVYDDEAEAERKAAEFRPAARRNPRNARVVRRGTRVYLGVAEPPQRLDVAAFKRAVSIAENP